MAALVLFTAWGIAILSLRRSHVGLMVAGPVTGIQALVEFAGAWMSKQPVAHLLPFMSAVGLLSGVSLYLFLVNLTRWVRFGRGLPMAWVGYLAGVAAAALLIAAGS